MHKFSGTLTVYEYDHWTQSGTFYSSTYNAAIAGQNINIQYTDTTDPAWSFIDTVSLNIQDYNDSMLSSTGTLTNSEGDAFSF